MVETRLVLLEIAGDALSCIASYTFEVRKTADDFEHLFIFALLLFHHYIVVVLWIEIGKLTLLGLDSDGPPSILLFVVKASLTEGIAYL